MDDFFGTLNQTNIDPAADFLAKEQAELDKIESINNLIQVLILYFLS